MDIYRVRNSRSRFPYVYPMGGSYFLAIGVVVPLACIRIPRILNVATGPRAGVYIYLKQYLTSNLMAGICFLCLDAEYSSSAYAVVEKSMS